MPKIHVRSIETQESVHSFECKYSPDSSNYERMLMGALRNMDYETYYLDTSEVEGA